MPRSILAAVLAIAACGPALPPPKPLGSSTDPGDQVECRDERTTRTNMARSVCLTHDQIDENRRAAQEWEKHPRADPTKQ